MNAEQEAAQDAAADLARADAENRAKLPNIALDPDYADEYDDE